MFKNKIVTSLFATLGIVGSLAVAAPAFAETSNDQQGRGWENHGMGMMGAYPDEDKNDNGDDEQFEHGPGMMHDWNQDEQGVGGPAGRPIRAEGTAYAYGRGIYGEVTAIDGTTITVDAFSRPDTSTTTYTVDASDATVWLRGATTTVSDIEVGNNIMVSGTLDGTNVTATAIRDGMPPRMMGNGPGPDWRGPTGNPPEYVEHSDDRRHDSDEAPHGFMGHVRSFFSHIFHWF